MSRRAVLQEPTAIGIMIFAAQRHILTRLRIRRGMVSTSQIARELIAGVSDAKLPRLAAYVGATGNRDSVESPTVVLEAADVRRLDALVEQSGARSRSQVMRFLIDDAEGGSA